MRIVPPNAWAELGARIRYVVQVLEDRRYGAKSIPPSVLLALEGLNAEIKLWRHEIPTELTLICRAHRRRCELQQPGEFGAARIRHVNQVPGSRGELCFSQRHLVRWESDCDRVIILDELVPRFAVQ